MTKLKELTKVAVDIKNDYGELNHLQGRSSWTMTDYMSGFVGDVGDLSKLVMMKKGVRGDGKNVNEKIAHELSDCLWSILVLAEECDIDLEKVYIETMNNLKQKIATEKVTV